MTDSVVALVPMRHHSERVPGKNYRSFSGRPLYHSIVSSLLACPMVSEVVIDTDSPVILEDAAQHFPQVRLIQRPEHLRHGTTPMNEVIMHDVSQVDSNYYLQTHSTNPLLRTESIQQAIQTFIDNYPTYDSLFSVTRIQKRLFDGLGRAVNHNPAIQLRTQDLPPIFEENSCLFVFSREVLQAKRTRAGDRPYMFELEPMEAMDIDEELDFRIAEFLYEDIGRAK